MSLNIHFVLILTGGHHTHTVGGYYQGQSSVDSGGVHDQMMMFVVSGLSAMIRLKADAK